MAGTALKEKCFPIFPNLRQNLWEYLAHLKQCSSSANAEYDYRIYNTEVNFNSKAAVHHDYLHAETETHHFINIDEIIKFFIDECQQNFMEINPSFAKYYLHLLIRDCQDGLELNFALQGVRFGRLEEFFLKALTKYKNQSDATLSSMKISYFFKNNQNLNLDYVKEKYELQLNIQLEKLIKNILQYPESSNDKQLEDLFIKMQIFIITNYQIGYPDNHVLLKQCRQALNSILSKGDIQKYVLRKRYHRLEYLRRLGATAAGILIFNNQGPEGDKKTVRNIFTDLKLADSNTKDFLQAGFDRVFYLKQKATEVILQLINLNVSEKIITFSCSKIQIQELNKFVVLFEIYKKKLERIKQVFEKTSYLIGMDQKKFDCVVEKIKEILKCRSAIESEVIFPHFSYLSELWKTLVSYLNHLVELNKIKDHLDTILNEDLEKKFHELSKNLMDKSRDPQQSCVYLLEEVLNSINKPEMNFNALSRRASVTGYCALTLALTGGVLVDSKLDKKLCEKINLRFGFANIEYAKFAEYKFKEFFPLFQSALLTNSDLIVLFELEDEVLEQNFNLIKIKQGKTKSLATQTEMISNDVKSKYQIEATWNIWDFHRKTIKLANIRKMQTHSTQSNLSFGTRNAYSQYDTKSYKTTQM